MLISAPVSRAQTSRLAMDYYTRADTSYRNGDLVGAIVDLEAAIAFDPGWAPPYLLTGNVRYRRGELDAALADFEQAIALNPRMAEVYNSRALARARKGDLDRAILRSR